MEEKTLQPIHLQFSPMPPWSDSRTTYAPLSWEVSFQILSEQMEEIAVIHFVTDAESINAIVIRDGKQYKERIEKRDSEGYETIQKQLAKINCRCVDPWFTKPIEQCYRFCSGRNECHIYRHHDGCILRKINNANMMNTESNTENQWMQDKVIPLVDCKDMEDAIQNYRIPWDIICKCIDLCYGQTPEKQEELKIRFAKDIRNSYPYRPGRDPRSKELYQELTERKVNQKNWLTMLNQLSDEEITCMLNNANQANLRFWLQEDRQKNPQCPDRLRAENIRDGIIQFYDYP